ncbi:hypothetical protein ACTTAL_11285 [Rhodobacter capsulatus]
MSKDTETAFAAALAARGLVLPEGMRIGAAARKQALGLGLVAVFLWVLRDKLASLDGAAILAALTRVDALSWGLALAATVASFAALAQYDALIHRALGTGTAPGPARRGGWTAIALSQTIGFGLVSGGAGALADAARHLSRPGQQDHRHRRRDLSGGLVGADRGGAAGRAGRSPASAGSGGAGAGGSGPGAGRRAGAGDARSARGAAARPLHPAAAAAGGDGADPGPCDA